MKKFFSLICLITCLILTVSMPVHATVSCTDYSLNDLQPIALCDGNIALSNGNVCKPITKTIDGVSFNNCYYIKGSDTDVIKIVFATDNVIFGKATAKPSALQIIKASSIKRVKEGSLYNRGVTLTTGSINVKTNYGEYRGALGLSISFTNTPSIDKYSSYIVMLTDTNGNTVDMLFVCHSMAAEPIDDLVSPTSNDESLLSFDYKDFNNGIKLKNGSTIFASTLKEMLGKGKYRFYGDKGIDVIASISKMTVEEGKTSFFVSLSSDQQLADKYLPSKKNKIMKLSVPFLHLERRNVIIDCTQKDIIDLLGSEFCDKVVDGHCKTLYIYPLSSTDFYIATTDASGMINIHFDSDVTDVLISECEISKDKLPVTGSVISTQDSPMPLIFLLIVAAGIWYYLYSRKKALMLD